MPPPPTPGPAVMSRPEAPPTPQAPPVPQVPQAATHLRPVALGGLASLGLVTLYLATIAVAQDWSHAFAQLSEDRWFVAMLSLGLGLQVGLFTYLRHLHRVGVKPRGQGTGAGVASMTISSGTSATAMLACCAHHLVEVLPVIGLSGAAAFLGAFKTPLLWVGVAMNLAGIAYMVWQVRSARAMACHAASV